jgi:hypothetical protein
MKLSPTRFNSIEPEATLSAGPITQLPKIRPLSLMFRAHLACVQALMMLIP